MREITGKVIKLNVGGVRFNVGLRTILKYPGTLFDVLLSRNFAIEFDELGYIFIDRDPEYFREILHFLRTGDSATIRQRPEIDVRRIVEEAKYFGIDQLVMEVQSTRFEWTCESSTRGVTGDVPAARCFAAAQYVGDGCVYLYGGCTANDTFFDTLYQVQVVWEEVEHRAEQSPVGPSGATGGASLINSTTTAGAQGSTPEPATRQDAFHFTAVRARGAVFPSARSGHAMVFCNGHLILLYGNDKISHIEDVFMYSTYSSIWTKMSCKGDAVEPRSGHTATVAKNGKIYLIGGKQIFPAMKTFSDVFEGAVDVDQAVITWRLLKPTPLPEGTIVERRGYHSAVAKGDHIYIHGGIVRDVYCNDVCIYDTVHNTWKNLIPGTEGYTPSTPRSGHVAVVHNDEMFVFGSYSEEHPNMHLYSFDLRKYQWRKVDTSGRPPARRAAPSGVLLPQDPAHALLPRLFLFGGFDISTRKCFNDVFTITL
jgi:hypothetical protein